MTIVNDPNLWVIGGLLFMLGLLIGMFLTAGGRRKWKTRYTDEISRRETLEREYKERSADWTARDKDRDTQFAAREKEWREQDSLRGAAAKSRRVAATDAAGDPVVVDRTDRAVDSTRDPVVDRPTGRDVDGDGVRNDLDRRPTDDRKA